jgi:hypothetical protein
MVYLMDATVDGDHGNFPRKGGASKGISFQTWSILDYNSGAQENDRVGN